MGSSGSTEELPNCIYLAQFWQVAYKKRPLSIFNVQAKEFPLHVFKSCVTFHH